MSGDLTLNLCSEDISESALAASTPLIIFTWGREEQKYSQDPRPFFPEHSRGNVAARIDATKAKGAIFVCRLDKAGVNLDALRNVMCATEPLPAPRAPAPTEILLIFITCCWNTAVAQGLILSAVCSRNRPGIKDFLELALGDQWDKIPSQVGSSSFSASNCIAPLNEICNE